VGGGEVFAARGGGAGNPQRKLIEATLDAEAEEAEGDTGEEHGGAGHLGLARPHLSLRCAIGRSLPGTSRDATGTMRTQPFRNVKVRERRVTSLEVV
jgi:hypothetical protein